MYTLYLILYYILYDILSMYISIYIHISVCAYPLYMYICIRIQIQLLFFSGMAIKFPMTATVELMTPPDVEGAEVCLAPGTTRHVDARPLCPCRSRSCEKMNTHRTALI